MKKKMLLVDFDAAGAARKAAALDPRIWDVIIESEDGGRAYRLFRDDPPDVVAIDFTAKPSHGLETAKSLHPPARSTRKPIFVFLDAKGATKARAKKEHPDAVFVSGRFFARAMERILS